MAYQEFNGIRFYRNETTGYWERARGVPRKMHVYVWEYYNGRKLPDGYVIHHIDFDKGNNTLENLRLMTASEHSRLHADGEFKGQQKAKEWHRSNAGRALHSSNGYVTSERWPVRTFKCEQCGREFTVKTPKADLRFCCSACKSAWRRDSGVDNEVRRCVVCGREFSVNKYRKILCCSRQCAAAFRRNKKH